MKCPFCGYQKSKVINSRDVNEGEFIRRRRWCKRCKHRFTTYERIEPMNLLVIKRDGTREFYDRNKVLNGIIKACEKRPISREDIENVVNKIEEKMKRLKVNEIPSSKIGELVIAQLKKLDKVAYIRFASVYKSFADITDFEKELKTIKRKK